MSKFMPIVGLGLVLVAVRPARAGDNPEMHQAQADLESARTHLQAAAHDYDGHRKRALELVNDALGQVRDGLATVEHRQKKVESKAARIEKRADALKAKADKLNSK
jgi:cob(I)alamin adenosyltransferase